MSNYLPKIGSASDDPDFWLDMRSIMFQHARHMEDNGDSWLGWLFWNENEMALEEYRRRRIAYDNSRFA
jgi:hypothetical protein